MVKQLFRIFNREIGGIHDAAYLLGIFAIASQLLGLVRDRLLAHSFGADINLDVYYAAFRVPDLIFVTVASLVSLSVLIPFLIEKTEKGKAESREFMDTIFSLFFILIVVVSIVAYALIPVLVERFFSFPAAYHENLITLSRIMLLSPILLGISNLLASVTQIYNRYFVYALSPILYNVGIIAGVLFLYPYIGISGLAWGVVVGAFMHLLVQVPFVVETGLFPRFTFRPNVSLVRTVILHSLPRTLTVSSTEIAKFALIAFASTFIAGSISVFTFSFNLQSVPLSVIGVSYSLAVFPTLTRLFSSGNRKEFLEKVSTSARHIVFLSLPAAVLFIVLRAQIVRTILGSGAFDWEDTRLTAAALALFIVSLVPQGLVLLFVRAYYSSGSTWKPFIINVASSIFIIASAVGLTRLFESYATFQYFIETLFRVSDVEGTVVLMLPLAYTVGISINAIFHWAFFEKDFGTIARPILRTFFESFSASVIAGAVAYGSLAIFGKLFDLNTLPGIFLQGLFSGLIGIVVCVLCLKLLGSHELADMLRTLHRKIWKTKVVAPDPNIG